jgi:hypothetical protein
MATVHLDDGVGDDPDFNKEFCEVCGNAIVGNDVHYDVFTYGILCGDCYDAIAEDEVHFEYPPADSDI